SYEEGSHRLDTDRKELDRPMSPETNFGGSRKQRKNKIAKKDKEAGSYSGDQKKSSNIIKPQRGSLATQGGTKGKSQKQIETEFKGSSVDMHQFSGRVKSNKATKSRDKNATEHKGNLELGANSNRPLRESSYSKNLVNRKSEKQMARDFERES